MTRVGKGEAHTNIAVVGPASSGKTTLVKRIIGQNPSIAAPTIGFDVKTFNYRGIKIFVTDLGGQKPFVINFWEKMLSTSDGVIFVMDAAAPNKFILAYDLFLYVLKKMNNVPMIVLANKQDLPEAASIEELEQIFNFEKARMRFGITSLKIFPVSALRGDGVTEALDHLWSQIVLRTAGTLPFIHDIFVYQRTTGRPVALARMKLSSGEDESSIQLKDPSLISAFYAALTTFSKEFVTSPVQSLRLRNPDPTNSDYFLFNYSDPRSNLSCLIITSGESNEILEEFLAERIISRLKQEHPWVLDEEEDRNYLNIRPLVVEIMDLFRTTPDILVENSHGPDEAIDDDFLWTKVLLSSEMNRATVKSSTNDEDRKGSRKLEPSVDREIEVEFNRDDVQVQGEVFPLEPVKDDASSKNIEKERIIPSVVEAPKDLTVTAKVEEKTETHEISSSVMTPTPVSATSDLGPKTTSKTTSSDAELQAGTLTSGDRLFTPPIVDKKEISRVERKDDKKLPLKSGVPESSPSDFHEDDDDEYYRRFRQLSVLDRVRELEKRRRRRNKRI